MTPFAFNTVRSIRFGFGLLNSIGEIASAHIKGKILIVTDPGMLKTGIVERAVLSIRQAGSEVIVYSDVVADPPEAKIVEAVALAQAENAQGVIGLGGGSSLDVAKLVALLAVGRERLADIYGVNNVKGARLPLLLVPTTAGTGSEVTPISIVTTGTNEKMGVVSPVILPDVALLDPELTLGLPVLVTAATGIDAMVHAIEAYTSASANNNPISRTLAEKALGLIGGALLAAVKDGTDRKARSDMLLGSMLAGQAFANAPVAAVHALAYPLGGHFHIPHGLSNALVLPHVLRFNAEYAPELYADLAGHTFPELRAVRQEDRTAAFVDQMTQLSVACGLPQTLREMQVPADMLPVLATDAMKQTRLLVNNPRPVAIDDALRIYERAF